MRIYSEQLAQELSTGLRACYLILGDEPLQKMECLLQIRKAASKAGFTDVYRFSTDEEPLPWNDIYTASQSLSLFATRQIIELDVSDKWPKEWPDRIQELLNNLNSDVLLIVLGPRINTQQSKSRWFTALNEQGVHIPVAFPDARFFPRWMQTRCQQHGIKVSSDGLTFLCHAFEGNLLAAAQELEKLALLNLPSPISLETLQHTITRQNAFDPFQWMDTLLDGKSQRGLRMLQQLRQEGAEPGFLCWTIAKDIELLWSLRRAQDARQSLALVFQHTKTWQSRQQKLTQALQRLSALQIQDMLQMLTELDRCIRTFDNEAAWLWLETLTLAFRGTNSLHFTLVDLTAPQRGSITSF